MIAPTPKQAQALALHRAGKKWTEIAKELGMTPRNAQTCAERAQIKEFRMQDAENERHARFMQQVAEQVRSTLAVPAPNPYLFTDLTVARLYGIEEQ